MICDHDRPVFGCSGCIDRRDRDLAVTQAITDHENGDPTAVFLRQWDKVMSWLPTHALVALRSSHRHELSIPLRSHLDAEIVERHKRQRGRRLP